MRRITLLLLLMNLFVLKGLSQVTITFEPLLNSKKIELDKPDSDSLVLMQLRFYISNVQLFQNERLVYALPSSYHLLDLADTASLTLQLLGAKDFSFTSIVFGLGIDSSTNVAGVMGGDLDPTKGMYWAWQSGYINLKLEGFSPQCKNPDHIFQFHLGGYSFPYNSYRLIKLQVSSASKFFIALELNRLLDNLDLSAQDHIMSPSTAAMKLSDKIAGAFTIVEK